MLRLMSLSWFALVMSLVSADCAANCVDGIRLAWSRVAPFAMVDAGGAPTGLDIDLVTAIFSTAGCRLKLINDMPGNRMQATMQTGQIDAQLAASDLPERHIYAWFSEPYRMEEIRIFARGGEAAIYHGASLTELASRGWRFLVPLSGWYGKELAALQPDLRRQKQLFTYTNYQVGANMLYHNRADLIIGDAVALPYTARQENLPDVESLPFVINADPVHLIFSKLTVSAADVATINIAIRKLTANGELRKIMDRYAAPRM